MLETPLIARLNLVHKALNDLVFTNHSVALVLQLHRPRTDCFLCRVSKRDTWRERARRARLAQRALYTDKIVRFPTRLGKAVRR